MTSKAALRKQCLAQRNQVSADEQYLASKRICERIQTLPQYQKAKGLALYRAVGHEINVDLLWASAVQAGKICYFPKLAGKTLLFLPAAPLDPFKPNRLGILEPERDAPATLDIPLFIVPLVAFDKRCHRIGSGQGYYDRALPQFKNPFCIGVGYAFQEVPVFEVEETDYPMDRVVTEKANK